MTKKQSPTKPKELDATGQPIKEEELMQPSTNIRWGESEAVATFRKQAEKHFKGPVFIVTDSEGQMEAFPVGKQAESPNEPTKQKKASTAPVRASERELYVPPVKVRVANYAKAYAFDMTHGTHELSIYRDAIRRAKQERLRKQFGLF